MTEMKRKLKRAFSLFLSLLMLCSVSTTVLFAEDAAGTAKIAANDLAAYGQLSTDIKAAETPQLRPTVDGKVSENEYTNKFRITYASAGMAFEGASETNKTDIAQYFDFYISYDAEKIYMAAVVQEDAYTFKNGNNAYSMLTLNFGFHTDGSSVTAMDRMECTLSINTDNSCFAGNAYYEYDSTGKWYTNSTHNKEGKNWDYMGSVMPQKKFVRSTDTDGNNITVYEFCLSKAILKKAFNLSELPDSCYFWFENIGSKDANGSRTGWQKYRHVLSTEEKSALSTEYKWTASFVGHLLHFVDNVNVSTMVGAELRMAEPTGLRFQTTVDKAFYDALVEKHGQENVTFGTLIAPAAYVTEAGAFTKEALDKLVKTSDKYLDVQTQTPYASDDKTYTFAGSIGNILSDHLTLEFAAAGYIQAGDEIYYSVWYTSRTASSVAIAALKDTKTTQTGEYQYAMKVNDTTVYSPYTLEQRVEINKLAVWGSDTYGASIGWEE